MIRGGGGGCYTNVPLSSTSMAFPWSVLDGPVVFTFFSLGRAPGPLSSTGLFFSTEIKITNQRVLFLELKTFPYQNNKHTICL